MFPEKKVAAAVFYNSWLQLQCALLLLSELENLSDCFALSLKSTVLNWNCSQNIFLSSSIPLSSTHSQTRMLSPLINLNWGKRFPTFNR